MRTALLALLLTLAPLAFAELASEVYRAMQRDAPEQAKVLRVMRSSANVKPGALISVRYVSINPCEGWVGARPIPILDEGAKVYAYLERAERGFEPAARGASFASELDR